MSDPAFRRMSVEEYLRTEPDSPVKREYVNGFVYVVDNGDGMRGQAGASTGHVGIAGNISAFVRRPARRAGCRPAISDMKLWREGARTFYYPDVMVACGDQADPYFEMAPCLLVEVLSRRTAAIDCLAKYAASTALSSLQTYLIVEQTERRVYAYQRQVSGWNLTEYERQGDIPLPCLGISLSLDEVYEDVL